MFPCFDNFEDYYKISTLRIGCNRPNFEIFALGKPNLVEKTDSTKVVEFEVNKVLNPSHLCLVLGPFQKISLPVTRSRGKSLSTAPRLTKTTSKVESMAEEPKQHLLDLFFMGEETRYRLERKI